MERQLAAQKYIMRGHEPSAESKATFGSIHIDLQFSYNAIPVDLALAIIKQNEELRLEHHHIITSAAVCDHVFQII